MYLRYFGKIQVGIEELSFSFFIQIRPEGSFVVFIFFSPNLVIGNGLHFVPELKKKNIEIFMVTNLQVIYSIWKQFLGKLQLLCSYGCLLFFFHFPRENYFNFLLLCRGRTKFLWYIRHLLINNATDAKNNWCEQSWDSFSMSLYGDLTVRSNMHVILVPDG